jgi:hypothetical protein
MHRMMRAFERLERVLYTSEPLPYVLLLTSWWWSWTLWQQYTGGPRLPVWDGLTARHEPVFWMVLWTLLPVLRVVALATCTRLAHRVMDLTAVFAWLYTATVIDEAGVPSLATSLCVVFAVLSMWAYLRGKPGGPLDRHLRSATCATDGGPAQR